MYLHNPVAVRDIPAIPGRAQPRQSISRGEDGPLRSLAIVLFDRCPSWVRYGKGHANIDARLHLEAGHLSLSVAEHGEKSSRAVLLTLPEESARELHDMLALRFARPVAVSEPTDWKITRAKKVYGVDLREAFGEFYAGAKAVADEYAAKGWTVTPLYARPDAAASENSLERPEAGLLSNLPA